MAIVKPSIPQILEVVSMDLPGVTDRLRDSMAIPSFLHWNPLIRRIVWQRYEVIAAMAEFNSNDIVLEFGCGAGLFLPEIHSHGCRIFAVDLYPEFARELSGRMKLNADVGTSMEYIADSTVTKVIAAEVFEHLENPEYYLDEIKRILVPGGDFFMSLPTENILYRTGKLLAGFHGKEDYHVSGLESILRKTLEHGFSTKKSRQLPSRLFPLYRVVHCRLHE